MTDYALCSGIRKRPGSKVELCPLKESCARWHGVPDRQQQSWIEPPFIKNECDMHKPVKK